MSQKPTVGVRYCGGCNPRYDRLSLVDRLAAALPELELVSAQDGVPYAAALVVCGCTARCADVSGLAVPAERQVFVASGADLPPARDKLRPLAAGSEGHTLTREQVMEILPHRPPMLLIDSAQRLAPGSECVASLYIDPAWHIFQGHFPGQPVLPGVYAVESMAQAADLLLLSQPRWAGKAPLLAGVEHARFKAKIAPGDTVEVHASLLRQREELAMATCQGQIFLPGGVLAAQAEITIALR